jgi:proteic killer suppression protein
VSRRTEASDDGMIIVMQKIVECICIPGRAHRRSRRLPHEIQRLAYRKLVLIHRSKTLDDLRVPPGKRLEALSGKREGHHSIRINQQWRVWFRWENGNAFDVEVTDYHQEA